MRAMRESVSIVPAWHWKEGCFTANGGAFWIELLRFSTGTGLIEGSTPECRGPAQLLLYQRAQDALLAKTSIKLLDHSPATSGKTSFIKNNRDSLGNVYGAQENYEATLGTGTSLFLWRAGLVLIIPFVLQAWAGFLLMLLGLLLYYSAAGVIYFLVANMAPRWKKRSAQLLFGEDLVIGLDNPCPAWLESCLYLLQIVILLPVAAAFLALARFTAFREIRRKLLPFLISRPIMSGCGTLEPDGEHFGISEKGPSRSCVFGLAAPLPWSRPIFTFGSFFKTLVWYSITSPRKYLELFSSRQRLQICLGDSNMAQVAEYLRIGTTLLVLDMIEAGEVAAVPRVRSPIRALKSICADPSLKATARATGNDGRGGHVTAIELQRFYLEAAKRFLKKVEKPSSEAVDVVRWWEETLDLLEASPERLVGSIDWVTKKHLLDEAGGDAGAAARKKIDIRYHELGSEGYFSRLEEAGMATVLVGPEDVNRAIQAPPPGTPAAMRSRYIREFAGTPGLRVNWDAVFLGRGFHPKVVRLSDKK